jgi:hypothetical protein
MGKCGSVSRRLVISDGALAKEATGFQIAQGGVVKPVLKALVAENGIAHQFWPPASGSNDPSIKWTTQPITSDRFVDLVSQPSIALLNLLVDGSYDYSDDADVNNPGTGNGTWLDMAVTGTGQYLIKADLVSGSGTVGDTLGVWLDAFTARSFGSQMAVQGVNTVVLDVTVAKGSVTPQAGSEITKRITFNANVTNAATKVIWSNTQWDLEEHTTNADADCDLNFFPNGTASGLADTSGDFNESWHEDAPVIPDPVNFTVNVALVSGTAPTGDALNTNLTLDVNRSWKLLATSGEDFSNVLDVTVSDGTASLTKRVTMHSTRATVIPANVWTTVTWFLEHIAVIPADGLVQVILNPDGTGQGSGDFPISEDWHSQAPAASDPQNFEAQLVPISGDAPDPVSSSVNIWLPITTQLLWEMRVLGASPPITPKIGVWNLKVRRINEPEVTKVINLNTGSEP